MKHANPLDGDYGYKSLLFFVRNRTGIKNQAADALSRHGTTGEDQTELNDEVLVLLIEVCTTIEPMKNVCATCYVVRYVTHVIPEVMKIGS